MDFSWEAVPQSLPQLIQVFFNQMKNSVLAKNLSSIFAQNSVFWRNKLNDLEPKWVIFLWKWSFFREKINESVPKWDSPPPKTGFHHKKNPESWEKFHSLSNEKLTTICKKRAILCWTGQKEKRNKRAISWNSAEQAPTLPKTNSTLS